jgi:hypothetical protein
MNMKEKVYTGLVIAMGCFLILGFLTMLTVVYPRTDSKGVFQMVMAIELLMALVYFATAFWNIRAGALATINTTVQIACIFPSVYGIPTGIWGIVLLRKRIRQPAPPPYGSPAAGSPSGEA